MRNAPTDEVMDQTDDNCNLYTAVSFPFFLFISFFTLYLSNALQTFCSLKQAFHSRSSDYMSRTRKSIQSQWPLRELISPY